MPFMIAQFALRTESLTTFGTPVLFGHAETPIENLYADFAATLRLVSRPARAPAIGESVYAGEAQIVVGQTTETRAPAT